MIRNTDCWSAQLNSALASTAGVSLLIGTLCNSPPIGVTVAIGGFIVWAALSAPRALSRLRSIGPYLLALILSVASPVLATEPSLSAMTEEQYREAVDSTKLKAAIASAEAQVDNIRYPYLQNSFRAMLRRIEECKIPKSREQGNEETAFELFLATQSAYNFQARHERAYLLSWESDQINKYRELARTIFRLSALQLHWVTHREPDENLLIRMCYQGILRRYEVLMSDQDTDNIQEKIAFIRWIEGLLPKE